MTGNRRFVQLPVQFRRGEGKLWLADHIKHLRCIGQFGQALSPALDQRRTAQNTERYVRADLRAQLAQGVNRQRISGVAVQRPQDGSRIRAAAAQPGAAGNPFCYVDSQTGRPAAEVPVKALRSAPCEIGRIRRDLLHVTCERPFGAFS